MRRKDRQKDENFALKAVDESLFGSVAIRDESVESGVFIVALSLARENFTLYAHGAKGGKKSELFKDGALAWINFVSYAKISDLGEERLEFFIKNEPKRPTSDIFTCEYRSAVLECRVYKIEDDEEKKHALRVICKRFTPKYTLGVEKAMSLSLNATNCYKFEILSLSAKEKKVAN